MRKILLALLMVLSLFSCTKEPKANFENRDYYIGDDLVNHPNASPCLDYYILEFKNGVVSFMEAYRDPDSPKKWSKKIDFPIGDASKIARYEKKQSGTYIRKGNEVIIYGLKGSNWIGETIEFTRAEIRGEKAGAVNLDVYYVANDYFEGELTGKINFIGKIY
jgi:hypothetical protein